MIEPVTQAVLRKVRKLALLPEEVRRSQWAVSVTRLTVLKNLCDDAEKANRFVTYLTSKTLEHVQQGKGRAGSADTAEKRAHREMMTAALPEMEAWLRRPTDERRERLLDLLGRMRDQQNEYKNIQWGPVRIVTDWDLLLFEYALHCLLGPAREAGSWAYQTARHYAERYNSGQGSGLVSSSAPLVQDIADFWMREFGLDAASIAAPGRSTKTAEKKRSSGQAHKDSARKPKARAPAFTHRQGQFLAFIHLYRRLHRRGPAELDMATFFRLTPPSVHGMVVKLEELGLITREPGAARSVRVIVPEADIPALEEVAGPPW
ncbi:MAG TPA: hypothetical protein VMS17_13595 [Gemmataceae bacterium]|nr:hypothetical protein [Gemmataceae bacterium]